MVEMSLLKERENPLFLSRNDFHRQMGGEGVGARGLLLTLPSRLIDS